jgi:hypothetical protein
MKNNWKGHRHFYTDFINIKGVATATFPANPLRAPSLPPSSVKAKATEAREAVPYRDRVDNANELEPVY